MKDLSKFPLIELPGRMTVKTALDRLSRERAKYALVDVGHQKSALVAFNEVRAAARANAGIQVGKILVRGRQAENVVVVVGQSVNKVTPKGWIGIEGIAKAEGAAGIVFAYRGANRGTFVARSEVKHMIGRVRASGRRSAGGGTGWYTCRQCDPPRFADEPRDCDRYPQEHGPMEPC